MPQFLKMHITKIWIFMCILIFVNTSGFRYRLQGAISKIVSPSRRMQSLNMAVYYPHQGVPSTLVEERDACGVGFIASLSNEASHDIIQQALAACSCMEHRGACSADNISGDGAGVLTAIPWELFKDKIDPKAVSNSDGSIATAVGMMFLPRDEQTSNSVIEKMNLVFSSYKLTVKGWRDVPVDSSVLGSLSADFVPRIKQVFVQAEASNTFLDERAFEDVLYTARREIQGYFRQIKNTESYTCSLSSKTIVYKGMLRSSDLSRFYLDLVDERYASSFAVYHRRFSTNTVPKWFLAQPMRLLAHNGEINTLLGNINWVKSRQQGANSDLNPGFDTQRLQGPLVDVGRSDSANLDSVLESYVRAGFGAEEALMILVPEAFESQPKLKDKLDVKAFYSYYEALQEAWDGPALLVFCDGNVVGASLDRNGLRPARYMLTSRGPVEDNKLTVHVMSEVGVTKSLSQFSDSAEANDIRLVDAGRLGPGEMLAVNMKEGKLYLNDEVKQTVVDKKPYAQLLKSSVTPIAKGSFKAEISNFISRFLVATESKAAAAAVAETDSAAVAAEVDNPDLITTQSFFGWGSEDVEVQITSMAAEGVEATYCMGDDAPLAAISNMPHTLYDYFKQRFAQVTNPAIDPLREGAVMSLSMFLGPRGDPTAKEPMGSVVKIESPVLNAEELAEIAATPFISMHTLSTVYPIQTALSVGGLQGRLSQLSDEAVAAVRAGANIVHLSDRLSDYSKPAAPLSDLTYVPPLLAVGAIHHKLISLGLRTDVSLVISTGQVWATHHFACLIGYGASAVVPYVAYDAVINWHGQKRNQLAMVRGDIPTLSASKAMYNYRKAVDKGLLKILSKMGISLLTSYHGAQIFEALGLADEVMLTAFKGTPCKVAGLGFDDIAAEGAEFSRITFGDEVFGGMAAKVEATSADDDQQRKKLFNYGFLNYFKSGEYHHNNQPLIKTLHAAIRTKDRQDLYDQYEQSVTSRPPTTFRDTLQFVPADRRGRQPVPLDQVESAESIMRRFCSGAMSLGALSREAHETLAIAMNRIGGKSNSGEGGEDPVRAALIHDVNTENGKSVVFPHLKGLQNGDSANSRIKQVASGRFGVTPAYLMSADQLEIKISQGAKPGEGGQLPGAKIDSYIATLRKSKPGVTLISPPPHHDIYSIEDLAQLIYDLHQINPAAPVSVKLVSEVGIGTVASGVTKAGADIIQISGHDGGTGASPATSIKHAGSPWELGLVESHSTLLNNGLRDRVLLRVDGGLKSGWDVVMAAAMGAEEFGFGTIALIAEGCIMARICHTNKCPVGVTTQNEALRKRFPGTPENVVTYFGYVAEEVRQIMARLGFARLDDLIGLPGLLEPRSGLQLKKTKNLDASFVINSIGCNPKTGENFCISSTDRSWLKHGSVVSNGRTFDDIILEDPDVQTAIHGRPGGSGSGSGQVARRYRITNTDRTAFARISGVLAKKYGDGGFQGLLQFDLTGAAGQSFCAFLSAGMDITLEGYANDYVGKGMAGGRVTVRPPPADLRHSVSGSRQFNVVGNTVLYGATGGQLFVRGRAGERFAVRNSGAVAVVEGLGDHGCEYMTAGNVVSLGSTGRNFGAGMTGGLAFVLSDESFFLGTTDEKEQGDSPFPLFVNGESVSVQRLSPNQSAAKEYLRTLLTSHLDRTVSERAAAALRDLDEFVRRLWVVVPASEKGNPLLAAQEISSVAVGQSVL